MAPWNVSVPVHPSQNASWGILARLRGILACYSRPTLATQEPFDELTLLDDLIGRLKSRLATGDDSELQSLGALMLKYLERRAEVLEKRSPLADEARPGSIAAATSRLSAVGRTGG